MKRYDQTKEVSEHILPDKTHIWENTKYLFGGIMYYSCKTQLLNKAKCLTRKNLNAILNKMSAKRSFIATRGHFFAHVSLIVWLSKEVGCVGNPVGYLAFCTLWLFFVHLSITLIRTFSILAFVEWLQQPGLNLTMRQKCIQNMFFLFIFSSSTLQCLKQWWYVGFGTTSLYFRKLISSQI